MTDEQALQLHNEDEVTVKKTNQVTTVLDSYRDKNNQVIIETTYDGFSTFYPEEIK